MFFYIILTIAFISINLNYAKEVNHAKPLNYYELIRNIHEKFKYENEYKKLNFGPIYRGFYETQKLFNDKFNGVSSLKNLKKFPDLSIPCYTQVFQWYTALNNNEYWAQAGIKLIFN